MVVRVGFVRVAVRRTAQLIRPIDPCTLISVRRSAGAAEEPGGGPGYGGGRLGGYVRIHVCMWKEGSRLSCILFGARRRSVGRSDDACPDYWSNNSGEPRAAVDRLPVRGRGGGAGAHPQGRRDHHAGMHACTDASALCLPLPSSCVAQTDASVHPSIHDHGDDNRSAAPAPWASTRASPTSTRGGSSWRRGASSSTSHDFQLEPMSQPTHTLTQTTK